MSGLMAKAPHGLANALPVDRAAISGAHPFLPTVLILLFQLIKQVLEFYLGNTLFPFVSFVKRGEDFHR